MAKAITNPAWLLLAALLAAIPATSQAADPTPIPLTELWRIGGDSEAEGEFFGVLSAVAVDEAGAVYLLDRQLSEVKVFDADGNYLRTIGREGEGPGEFRETMDLFLTAAGKVAVVQIMPGKIVLLEPDGTPLGNFQLPELPGGGNGMIWAGAAQGERIVVEQTTMKFQETKGVRTVALVSYAEGEADPIRYFESSSDLNLAMLEIDERKGLRPTWVAGADGSIYVVPTFGEYLIHAYRPDGTLERTITREYDHLMRTEMEKQEMRSRFIVRGPTGETKITVSEHHPDIGRIFPRKDGSLWVLTSRGRREPPAGSLGVFDVFDRQGVFVRQIALQGTADPTEDLYFIDGDRLYVLTGFQSASRAMHAGETVENAPDDEGDLKPMEVVCFQIDGDLAREE